MVTVALVYNLIHPETLRHAPLDALAEYDDTTTIQAIHTALTSAGHHVIDIEADEAIAERLRSVRPDIVFNIAEGLRGESRESHVPAICEMLGLAYTGSTPLTLALCLNKARTKEILLHYGIPTPRFVVLNDPLAELSVPLRYPLIVKLLQEGSSMGLSERSIVDDEAALRAQVAALFRCYHEPLLVEEFIQGREFTVGVLGNGTLYTLPITEVVFQDPRGIVLFAPDAAMVALYREQGIDVAALPQAHHRSVCPAQVPPTLQARIEQTALRAFRALGCRDWGRVDMRLALDGELYVLELNPIAGIAPGYWLPRSAEVAGLSYADFINEILTQALLRGSKGSS